MEFFKGIDQIRYRGKDSKTPFAFRYYNPDETVGGKTMREQLRFAMSYWHTMCAEGTDMFGAGMLAKTYGATDPMESAKNKAYAAFELMNKLDIDFYCFHDRDIAPEGETLKESNARLDVITDLLGELMAKYNKKLLWARQTALATSATCTAPALPPTQTSLSLRRHRSKRLWRSRLS